MGEYFVEKQGHNLQRSIISGMYGVCDNSLVGEKQRNYFGTYILYNIRTTANREAQQLA